MTTIKMIKNNKEFNSVNLLTVAHVGDLQYNFGMCIGYNNIFTSDRTK